MTAFQQALEQGCAAGGQVSCLNRSAPHAIEAVTGRALFGEVAAAFSGCWRHLAGCGQLSGVMFRRRGRGKVHRPACYACRHDGVYHDGRFTRATVRAQIPFEPWVLNLCDRHLATVRQGFPANMVKVTRTYGSG